jgi:hypothetical protein
MQLWASEVAPYLLVGVGVAVASATALLIFAFLS